MATLTITIPNEQIPRLQEAFAFALGLGSPATQVTVTTVEEYVVADLKQFVKNAELRQAQQAVTVGSPETLDFAN